MRNYQNLSTLISRKDTGSPNVWKLDGDLLAGREDSKWVKVLLVPFY